MQLSLTLQDTQYLLQRMGSPKLQKNPNKLIDDFIIFANDNPFRKGNTEMRAIRAFKCHYSAGRIYCDFELDNLLYLFKGITPVNNVLQLNVDLEQIEFIQPIPELITYQIEGV